MNPEVIRLWSPAIGFLRCYGVIPFKKSNREPYFERCAGSYVWGLFLSFIYLFILGIWIVLLMDSFTKPTAILIETCHTITYYCHSELTLVFFFLNSENLLSLFQQWIRTERLLSRIKIELRKKTMIQCWGLYVTLIILSTLENIFFLYSTVSIITLNKCNSKCSDLFNNQPFFLKVAKVNSTNPEDMLERLAGQETRLESYFGKYKSIFSVTLLMASAVSEVAWTTGDLIIALISVILHRYYEVLLDKLLSLSFKNTTYSNTLQQLEEIYQAQLAISLLAQKASEVFSPLIFITVGCNTIYILAFLYSGLEEDLSNPSMAVRFMFAYSFIYLILRFSISFYLGSRLTEMVINFSLNVDCMTINFFLLSYQFKLQPSEVIDCLFRWPSFVASLNVEQQRTRLIKVKIMLSQVSSR